MLDFPSLNKHNTNRVKFMFNENFGRQRIHPQLTKFGDEFEALAQLPRSILLDFLAA
jgi:hypothetical protein